MLASRVKLIVPDVAMLDAAIEGAETLGRALGGCEVADDWEVFPEALPAKRDALARNPGSSRWRSRLFMLEEPPMLVGWGGFKGPPADGVVELGYSVAPALRGRGIASGAVREMLREAFFRARGAVGYRVHLGRSGPLNEGARENRLRL